MAVSAKQGDSNRQSEVEDFDLGGGMFDEDAAEERLAMEPGMAKPPPNPEPAPWGLQPHQGRSAKKKHLKGGVLAGRVPQRPGPQAAAPSMCGDAGVKQPSAPEVKAPKAVLQQFCHSEGRAPPKFERLAPGGNRLATAGVRCTPALHQMERLLACWGQHPPLCMHLDSSFPGQVLGDR